MNPLKNDPQDVMEKGMKEMKKSGNDWLEYVQKHPLQTMFFGLIAYFATKGIVKE